MDKGKDKVSSSYLCEKTIVLILKERKKQFKENEHKSPSSQELFQAFINANRDCPWNPHLQESIRNIQLVGHLEPLTLLLAGREIFVDTIKNAWARRVLQSPPGFSLHKFGELDPLVLEPVPQAAFTPLPEALCLIVAELNRQQTPASLERVQQRLGVLFRGVQQPAQGLVYEALGGLVNEHKLLHTGNGYFVVTPDTYQLGLGLPALPALYLPVHGALPPSDTCSIACQTAPRGAAEGASEQPEDGEEEAAALQRTLSLRSPCSKNKRESKSLTRSSSVRYGEDKAKSKVSKLASKAEETSQDADNADKHEKRSLFSKLFHRNKTKRDTAHGIEEDPEDETTVEHVTFSAQFPPPEWEWYQQQLQVQLGQPDDVTAGRAGTRPASADDRRRVERSGQRPASADSVRRAEPRAATLPATRPHSGSRGRRAMTSQAPRDLPPLPGPDGLKMHRRRHRHRPRPAPEEGEVLIDGDVQQDCRADKPRLTGQYRDSAFATSSEEGHYEAPVTSQPGDVPRRCEAEADRPRAVYCGGLGGLVCQNDISVEYIGRLPRRDTLSVSRGSGVNCVGLTGPSPRQPGVRLPGQIDTKQEEGCITKADVHPLPGGKHPEDSGFSSPRTTDQSESGMYGRLANGGCPEYEEIPAEPRRRRDTRKNDSYITMGEVPPRADCRPADSSGAVTSTDSKQTVETVVMATRDHVPVPDGSLERHSHKHRGHSQPRSQGHSQPRSRPHSARACGVDHRPLSGRDKTQNNNASKLDYVNRRADIQIMGVV